MTFLTFLTFLTFFAFASFNEASDDAAAGASDRAMAAIGTKTIGANPMDAARQITTSFFDMAAVFL